jgi:hypothetical protein
MALDATAHGVGAAALAAQRGVEPGLTLDAGDQIEEVGKFLVSAGQRLRWRVRLPRNGASGGQMDVKRTAGTIVSIAVLRVVVPADVLEVALDAGVLGMQRVVRRAGAAAAPRRG